MSSPAPAALTRLEEIVGGANILTDAAQIAARRVDGLLPSAVVRPTDAAQVAEIVRFANSERLALIPCGGCSKLGIGAAPARYDLALDLTLLNRVLAYDPRDLTLSVEPGVRIADVLGILGDQKQFLPLAVPFSERATIGGIVATNSSSPLRHAHGGVRDFCLGMEFVTGDGVPAKSGGRVVKNVTGYDLHKLLIGSLGTLAVITRVNFRTFPVLAAHGTFIASFADAAGAFGFCGAIAQSALSPQIVEAIEPGAAHFIFSGEPSGRIAPLQWPVVVSVSGSAEVVDRHAHELGRMARAGNADEFVRLGDSEPSNILARVREFPRLILEAAPSAAIFRIGALPMAMASLLGQLRRAADKNGLDFAAAARASGIIYAAFLPKEGDAAPLAALARSADEVFQVCAGNDTPAMLEWASVEVKRSIGSVWGPERPDFKLMQRVKRSFDPQNVLSPGRFAGGI